MDYLKLEHFDAAYEDLRELFDDSTRFDAAYQSARKALNISAIEYCLRTFITAELDAATAGERGLGRVTTAVPRLGAYCRRQIRRLDASAQWQLYFLIQGAILRGYLTQALLIKDPRPVCVIDPETIFRMWVPVIYSSAGAVSEGVADGIAAVADAAFQRLDAFFGQHDMPSPYDDKARMGEIMWPYAKSGANLRAVECGSYGS